MRMLFRLQREREDVGCEMDMREVAHAWDISIGVVAVDMGTYSRVMST